MNDKSYFEDYLSRMEKKAKREHIPIISTEVGCFLKLLIKIKKPERVLEVGTAIGYSTIVMATALNKEIEIVTIEKDEKRALEARKNFRELGLIERINLKIGDALEILPHLRRKFDFIFLDAAKGQYIYFLDYILELLPPEGFIVADNVLYRGLVLKKKKITHKRRSMVHNLRDYLTLITNHEDLDSIVLPVSDGLALSIRRNKDEKT